MNHQTGGLGGRVVTYFCANELFGHHNGMEDVLQGCGNGSSPPLPVEVGPLIASRESGERFSSPSGSVTAEFRPRSDAAST